VCVKALVQLFQCMKCLSGERPETSKYKICWVSGPPCVHYFDMFEALALTSELDFPGIDLATYKDWI
jgi:hypothetical protein